MLAELLTWWQFWIRTTLSRIADEVSITVIVSLTRGTKTMPQPTAAWEVAVTAVGYGRRGQWPLDACNRALSTAVLFMWHSTAMQTGGCSQGERKSGNAQCYHVLCPIYCLRLLGTWQPSWICSLDTLTVSGCQVRSAGRYANRQKKRDRASSRGPTQACHFISIVHHSS